MRRCLKINREVSLERQDEGSQRYYERKLQEVVEEEVVVRLVVLGETKDLEHLAEVKVRGKVAHKEVEAEAEFKLSFIYYSYI